MFRLRRLTHRLSPSGVKSHHRAATMDPPVGRGHVAGCHAAPLTWEGLLRFLLLSGDLGKPGEVALGRPYRASILLPWVPGQKANRVLKGAT